MKQFGVVLIVLGVFACVTGIAFSTGLMHDAHLPLPLCISGTGFLISGVILDRKP